MSTNYNFIRANSTKGKGDGGGGGRGGEARALYGLAIYALQL